MPSYWQPIVGSSFDSVGNQIQQWDRRNLSVEESNIARANAAEQNRNNYFAKLADMAARDADQDYARQFAERNRTDVLNSEAVRQKQAAYQFGATLGESQADRALKAKDFALGITARTEAYNQKRKGDIFKFFNDGGLSAPPKAIAAQFGMPETEVNQWLAEYEKTELPLKLEDLNAEAAMAQANKVADAIKNHRANPNDQKSLKDAAILNEYDINALTMKSRIPKDRLDYKSGKFELLSGETMPEGFDAPLAKDSVPRAAYQFGPPPTAGTGTLPPPSSVVETSPSQAIRNNFPSPDHVRAALQSGQISRQQAVEMLKTAF